ncbi:hypothetical protein GE09DRAFT_303873 [Coniochaeta sp. 2T2.1]|nr:hypothetical protein GE09DRAFT_303873 [Coniochaeta sp. 2T2.1]
MNTTAARYTPLESLLLFQSLLTHGIEAQSFLQTANLLQNNKLVKESDKYDASRLSPEALQELFLHLLREELKAESENTEKPDGGPGLSPNSRKRKLASPPLPTLQEARQHLEKLPVLVDRLYARYRNDAIREIREEEERFDRLQREIHDIETRGQAIDDLSNISNDVPVTAPVTSGQNGHTPVPVSDTTGEVKLPNGDRRASLSPQQQQQPQPPPLQPRPQPQLQPQVQQQVQPQPQLERQPQLQPQQQPQFRPQQQEQPRPQPHAQPQLQPQQQPQFQPVAQLHNQTHPHPAARPEGLRNGAPSPQPSQSLQERVDSATPPLLAPQLPDASQAQPPRLSATPAAPSPPVIQQEPSRPVNGPAPVLQPPQGVTFPNPRQGPLPPQGQGQVQGEGLQRPEGTGRGKISPTGQPSQQAVPGQLKWEPLYQPNQIPPQYRQPQAQGQLPQQRAQAGPQAPQGPQQQQWNQQVSSPYGSPRPLQAQTPTPQGQPLQPPMRQPQQQPVQQTQQQLVSQQMQQQPQQLQQSQQSQQMQQPIPSRVPQKQTQQPMQQQGQHQAPHQPIQQQQVQQPAQQQQLQRPIHPPNKPAVQQQTLAPAPGTGHFSPASEPATVRAPTDGLRGQTQSRSPALNQGPTQASPSQPPLVSFPGYQQFQQNRPLAAASTTPPAGTSEGPRLPQQRGQPVTQRPTPVPQTNSPAVAGPSPAAPYAPYNGHGAPPQRLQPRPAIPDHVLQQTQLQQGQRHTGVSTPTPASRVAQYNSAPQTPVPQFRPFQIVGSGTSWKFTSTPSTPRPEVGPRPSPAVEPLSPVLTPAVLAPAAPPAPPTVPPTLSPLPPATPAQDATPQPDTGKSVTTSEPQGSVSPVAKRRGRPPRSTPKVPDPSLLTPLPPPATSLPKPSPQGERQSTKEPDTAAIKHEETTPQPPTDTGDTTADESVTGRRQVSRAVKRKRQDTASPTPVESHEPPGPPTQVRWTRAFNRVSEPAMEQIVGHRDANFFAHPIRERDAPGYRNRILQPQDLRSIRNAITSGNRAAAQLAKALPGGDPGTPTVLVPISEEVVPPKGIINSVQLERELAHMLANAVMYNPDPNRGPGPAFMRSDEEVDAEDEENGNTVVGYKMDENGIVNNARAMFVEVEKQLSDMRAAEIRSGAPPTPSAAAGAGTRQASVAGGGGHSETPGRRDEASSATAAEERDDQTPVESESVGNASKRRRITRG